MEGVVTRGAHCQVEGTESAGEWEVTDYMHAGTCPVGFGDLGLRHADVHTQPLHCRNHSSGLLTCVVDVACSECDQCHATVQRQPQCPACCLTIVKLSFINQGHRTDAYAVGI